MLSTFLKTIVVKKCAYPNFIVHSLKRSRHSNTRVMDTQPSDLLTISPRTTPMGFKPVTSTLIPLVRPQELSTLLKAIVIKKNTYLDLIMHSLKRPRHLNTRGVDGRDQPFDLPTIMVRKLCISTPSNFLRLKTFPLF